MYPKDEQSCTVDIAKVLEAKKQAVLQLIEEAETVVLVGEAGVGKSWLATEVCASALALYKSYGTVWILQEDKYEAKAVAENIARQLVIFPPTGELDEDGLLDEEIYVRGDWSYNGLKERISEKLPDMVKEVIDKRENASKPDAKPSEKQQKEVKFATIEDKLYLLAVLDDIPAKDEAEIVNLLKDILKSSVSPVDLPHDLPQPPQVLLKFLITTRNSAKNAGPDENGDTIQQEGSRKIYQVTPLSMDESHSLLCASVGTGVSGMPTLMKLEYFAKISQGLPAAIVMIAHALGRIGFDQINETCKIAMEGANIGEEPANVERLLTCATDMLPSNVMKDCFWHSRQLFSKCRRIHYDELITYWILEGFFNYDEIEQSYGEAHIVLMELRDRCLLKGQGNSHISMESILNEKLSDRTHGGLSRAANLGLASVLENINLLGKVTRMDGMIKTYCRYFNDISTLIIDGYRLFREDQERFFGAMRGLKVLAILNPKFEALPSSLLSLINLQVLVLRGCHLLKNIDGIHQLTNLLSLEVSGARSLESINDDLFKEMTNLRSVNLSEAGVRTLPKSLLDRHELRWLILRECKNLPDLPSLKELLKLEVLDLSGAASLELLRDKKLENPRLQTINLSRTKIRRLPVFEALEKFSRLLLRDCQSLKVLFPIKKVNALEIVDLSGAAAFTEMRKDFPENNSNLRLLDLSKSGITSSPFHGGGSSNHSQSQSTVSKLETLESLDLSGVSSLEEINGTLFEHLKLLRALILSGTNVKELQPLSHLAELRRLVLRDCKSLTKLEGLDALSKLEVIDLSGCKAIEISEDTSFQHMSFLRTLDLSETSVEQLPSDCFPSGLCILRLRNCSKLKQLPSVESLLQLEILDLYGAESLKSLNTNFLLKMSNLHTLNLSKVPLQGLPSLSHLIKLKELSLQGFSHDVAGLEALTELKLLDLSQTKIKSLSNICTTKLQLLSLKDCVELDDFENLEFFTKLEVLDLSGTRMRDFPYKILDFTHLRQLVMKNMKEIGEIDWTKVNCLPQKLDLESFNSRRTSASDKIPSIFICGAQFFQHLRKNEDLWQNCFQRFHFFVWLHKDRKDGTGLCYRDMGFFRYFNSRERFSFLREHDCLLEILGSDSPDSWKDNLGEATSSDTPHVEKNNRSQQAMSSDTPLMQKDAIRQARSAIFSKELKSVLQYAMHVSLIDSSIVQLSQIVDENVSFPKSLWMERCTKIKFILSGDKDTKFGEEIKDLYLSNLPSLKSLCIDKMQCGVFSNLKSLSLDSCPKLESILTMAKLPQNLEILQIKFCNMVDMLFKADASEEPTLLKLHSLELLDLPNLKSIGASLPALKKMKVRCCPKLEKLEKTLEEAESLEVLCVSDMAGLKSLCSRGSSSRGLKNLKMLKLESCPDITEVFTLSQLPSNLIELEIKCCDKLRTVCDDNQVDCCPFSNLSKLYLWKLPELSDKWGRVASCRDYCVIGCPKFNINI